MLRDRKNIRLRNYDYASDGWYFVTICTGNRECYFGKIENKTMCPSDIGIKASEMWNEIPDHFPAAELAEFVVMPNHIHGIIGIHHKYLDEGEVRTRHGVSPQKFPQNAHRNSMMIL